MRVETREYKIYDYKDVINNEELKQRVLDKHWDINIDYEWWDWIVDEWIEKNEKKGIEFSAKSLEFELDRYRGCKCDYDVDIDKLLPHITSLTEKEKERVKLLIDNGVCSYDSYIPKTHPLVKKMFNKLFHEIERMEGLARNELYYELDENYQYLTSEEGILNTIESNNWEFDENGCIA